MRHAYTLFFLVWGGVLILMALVRLLRGRPLSTTVAMVCMGLIGIALAYCTWTLIGRSQKQARPQAAIVDQPRAPEPSLETRRQSTERSATLAMRMAVQLSRALGVWFVVVLLASLAGAVFLGDTNYVLNTGLLRFGALFWKSFLIVLAADLVLWLAHFNWVNDEPGPGSFSKIAAIVFAALPILVGVLGATSLLRHRDPWEYLPGGPPFALREFAAKHPQLHVETVGALGGDVVALTSGPWPRVVYATWDLREAQLIWEKCADAGAPSRLGGPPAFPGSQCLLRIDLRRPDWDALSEGDLDREVAPPELRIVRYVYDGGGGRVSEVTQHFLTWAKTVGPEPNLYGRWMEVPAAGKTWTIEVRGGKLNADYVYVDYTVPRAAAR